jgi:hypothetical protein
MAAAAEQPSVHVRRSSAGVAVFTAVPTANGVTAGDTVTAAVRVKKGEQMTTDEVLAAMEPGDTEAGDTEAGDTEAGDTEAGDMEQDDAS